MKTHGTDRALAVRNPNSPTITHHSNQGCLERSFSSLNKSSVRKGRKFGAWALSVSLMIILGIAVLFLTHPGIPTFHEFGNTAEAVPTTRPAITPLRMTSEIHTYPVEVNYSLSLEKAIAADHYDKSELALEIPFPAMGKGIRKSEIILVHFNRIPKTTEIREIFKKEGLRFANIRELLAVGTQNSNLPDIEVIDERYPIEHEGTFYESYWTISLWHVIRENERRLDSGAFANTGASYEEETGDYAVVRTKQS